MVRTGDVITLAADPRGGLGHHLQRGVDAVGGFVAVADTQLSPGDLRHLSVGVDAKCTGDVDDARVSLVGGAVDGRVAGGTGEAFEERGVFVRLNIAEREVVVEPGAAAGGGFEIGTEVFIDPLPDLLGLIVICAM